MLIYGVIVPIIFGVLGGILLVIGIIRAVHIASADNEETKKRAVKSMIWFVIGFVLWCVVVFATSAPFNFPSSPYAVPTRVDFTRYVE